MQQTFLQALPHALTNNLSETVGSEAAKFVGDPMILVWGIVMIVVALLVIFFLKRIILNSVLGIVGWAIVIFIFKIELPWIASLVVSVVFGLAGVGTMLLLKFLGIV